MDAENYTSDAHTGREPPVGAVWEIGGPKRNKHIGRFLHQSQQMGTATRLTTEETNELYLLLGSLTRLQYEALQKSPYIAIPHHDADTYDKRSARIVEICEMLKAVRVLQSC